MAGRVLIYDGIAANRIILRCKLSAACYQVAQAGSYADLARRCASERPDIVILDLDEDRGAALDLCRSLVTGDGTAPSLLALTGSRDPGLRRGALQAGAFDVLDKPVHDGLLMAALRHVLRERHASGSGTAAADESDDLSLIETVMTPPSPSCVAVVTTRHSAAWHWPSQLRALDPHVRTCALAIDQALARSTDDGAPDLYVLHAGPGPNNSGLSILSELRSRATALGARTIVVLDAPELPLAARQTEAAMAYDLGADGVLLDGFDAVELRLRVMRSLARKRHSDRIQQSLQNGMRLATRDPLTGLYNRRYALPCLQRMMRAAQSQGQALSLLALDLDRFKAVNDTRGHAAGDAVLVDVARRLGECLHPRDLVARSGGEEFWIAIAGADEDDARAIAQTLCRRIRANPVCLPGRAAPIRVTASIGVAVAPANAPGETVEALLARADRALYTAKAGGRDMFTVADCAA